MNTTNCTNVYNTPEYVGVFIASVVSGFCSFTASALVVFLILFLQEMEGIGSETHLIPLHSYPAQWRCFNATQGGR